VIHHRVLLASGREKRQSTQSGQENPVHKRAQAIAAMPGRQRKRRK